MKVYEMVREHIRANGLKQCAVARKAGISENTFSAIMNGKRHLHADELLEISRALDCPIGTFVPTEERPA